MRTRERPTGTSDAPLPRACQHHIGTLQRPQQRDGFVFAFRACNIERRALSRVSEGVRTGGKQRAGGCNMSKSSREVERGMTPIRCRFEQETV